MNIRLLVSLALGSIVLWAGAQEKGTGGEKATGQSRIYKCGNEYTNTASDEQLKNCKLVTGGNITVVPAQKVAAAPAPAGGARSASVPPRADGAAQRERDNDTRAILEAELKKTEARLAELHKEFNGGEPEKRGDEARNYQKYLDRVSELKASILRTESDIGGIKRELGRLP